MFPTPKKSVFTSSTHRCHHHYWDLWWKVFWTENDWTVVLDICTSINCIMTESSQCQTFELHSRTKSLWSGFTNNMYNRIFSALIWAITSSQSFCFWVDTFSCFPCKKKPTVIFLISCSGILQTTECLKIKKLSVPKKESLEGCTPIV